MSLHVDYSPECPNPNKRFGKSKIIILIEFTIIMLGISIFVSYKSIKKLLLASKKSGCNFFIVTFYCNIILFWLSFIGYTSGIIICSVDYFRNKSIIATWIPIINAGFTCTWILQIFVIEITSVTRFYITFANTEFKFNELYIGCLIFSYIIGEVSGFIAIYGFTYLNYLDMNLMFKKLYYTRVYHQALYFYSRII